MQHILNNGYGAYELQHWAGLWKAGINALGESLRGQCSACRSSRHRSRRMDHETATFLQNLNFQVPNQWYNSVSVFADLCQLPSNTTMFTTSSIHISSRMLMLLSTGLRVLSKHIYASLKNVNLFRPRRASEPASLNPAACTPPVVLLS
jgi:hypothetical protein